MIQAARSIGEGRYRLIRRIGRGGMATVWEAWDENLAVFRAVKVLEPGFAPTSAARQRFENEARTMARLRHPNLLSVYDVGRDGDQRFLVMDLAPGGSLAELLERTGPLDPRPAARLLRGILLALQHAHDQGVVHRDVKPANLLIDAEGRVLVGDFGIARVDTADLTRSGAAMGTLAYMAPEQRSAARDVDGRADVYAAGGTLFALLTGREPHDLFMPTADFTGVHPTLEPMIRKASAHDRAERWATAKAFADALDQADPELPGDASDRVAVGSRRPALAPLEPDAGATFYPDPGPEDPVPPAAPSALRSRRPLLAVVVFGVVALSTVALWPRPTHYALQPLPSSWNEQEPSTFGVPPGADWALAQHDDALWRVPLDGSVPTRIRDARRDERTVPIDARRLLVSPHGDPGPIRVVDGPADTPIPGLRGSWASAGSGGSILFEDGATVYTAALDGTGLRKVVAVPGDHVDDECTLPDGRVAVLYQALRPTAAIYSADGEGSATLLLEDDALALPTEGFLLGCAPDGRLVVARRHDASNELVALDPDRPGWAVPIANFGAHIPVGIAAAPGRSWAVLLRDTETFGHLVVSGESASDPRFDQPHFLAWLDPTHLAWMSAVAPAGAVLDTATGRSAPLDVSGVDRGIPGWSRRLVAVGSRLLFLEPRHGASTRLLELSSAPPRLVSALPDTAVIACSRDRCVVAIQNGSSTEIHPLDPATATLAPPSMTLPAGRDDLISLALAVDGHLALATGDGAVTLVDPTGVSQRVPLGLDSVQELAFSPDGGHLLATFVARRRARIGWLSVDHPGDWTPMAESDGWLFEPAVSPDGTHVAWLEERHTAWIARLVPTDEWM